MNEPQMTEQAKTYFDAKVEYLNALGELNTSYGSVSQMNAGFYGAFGQSPTDSLLAAEDHLAKIAKRVQRAEELRVQLLEMINLGWDKQYDEHNRAAWAFHAQQLEAGVA